MSRITVLLACSVLAVGTSLAIQRSHNLNVNDRWIMTGARCQTFDYDKKSKMPVPREGQFQELKSFTLSKTVDSQAWVIRVTDYEGCSLSFWGESGKVNEPVDIRSISSY